PLPGPIPFPLIGSLAIFIEDVDDWFWRLNKKYGHNGIYELNIAGNRQIVVTRAEYANILLDNKSHMMRTPNNGLLDLFDLEKKGLGMNHNYNHWKVNRPIFSRAFIPLSVIEKANTIGNRLSEEMIQHWIDLKHPGEKYTVIDVPVWMRRFTADFISTMATGKQMSIMKHYCQKLKNEPLTEEILGTEELVECIHDFISDNQMVFVPKGLRNMPFIKPRVDRLLNTCDRFYKQLVDIIKERRKKIEKEIMHGKLNTEQMDLLTSSIIAYTKYDPHPQENVDPSLARPMTDDEIRGLLFDAFIGGTDTIVNTFTFALYYIMHHPEVKEKLLKEIETVFKDDPNRPITLEDVSKLKYTEAIVKETSRIRPTVSMLSRYVNPPNGLAGYVWPTKALFVMYFRGINNNPRYWKDPDRFIPERFYESREIYKNSFLMFGGGPGICPGRKLAMHNLKMLLAALYRKFDVELIDMQAPLKVRTQTISMCHNLNIRVVPKE
ncbi:782_t:CDS:2, partial [Paraglomus occultum]